MPNYPKLGLQKINALESTAKIHLQDVNTIKADTKKNPKNAKANKPKLAAAETAYKAAQKAIVDKATKDIKIAQDGFKKMSKLVEDCNGAVLVRLSAARAGLATFKKSNDAAAVKPCVDLKKDVDALAQQASDDVNDFAASWNAYREAKLEVDKAMLKEFAATRKKIIDETVVIRTKINKMLSMAAEAHSLEAAGAAAVQDFETSEDNKLKQAQDLLASVDHALNELYKKNDPRTITNGKQQVENWVKLPTFATFSMQLDDRRAKYQAMVATAQAANQAKNNLKRTLKNSQEVFTARDAKDPDIGPVLKAVTTRFSTFETDLTQALKDLPEVAKLMSAADARIKEGR